MRRVGLKAAVIVAALLVSALPSARATVAVVHPTYVVYQATQSRDKPMNRYRGSLGLAYANAGIFAGFFDIDPGASWTNYVAASAAKVTYSVKNVILKKTFPQTVNCSEIFPTTPIAQEGTPNIRLHWPLLYELPGTTWQLSILYGTATLWDDDGPTGPNPASYVHQELWSWQVDATWESMAAVVELFHELPFGVSEVPLISDDAVYAQIFKDLDLARAAVAMGQRSKAGTAMSDLNLLLMDSCISTAPPTPIPAGIGTGIAQTSENPACCKLIMDADYLVDKYHLRTIR